MFYKECMATGITKDVHDEVPRTGLSCLLSTRARWPDLASTIAEHSSHNEEAIQGSGAWPPKLVIKPAPVPIIKAVSAHPKGADHRDCQVPP